MPLTHIKTTIFPCQHWFTYPFTQRIEADTINSFTQHISKVYSFVNEMKANHTLFIFFCVFVNIFCTLLLPWKKKIRSLHFMF